MAVAVATPQVQPTSMQGIAIPAAILDKNEFFKRTRRHIQQEKVVPFTLGTSTQDVVSLRKSDILGEVVLHITGSLVITGTTVNSLAAWPYNLIKNVKFHSYVESQEVALQNGENEVRITGQGAGKAVLRMIYRLENGTPSAPVPMTSANFGLQAWRYATSETPDQFVDGSALRIFNERMYSADLGGLQGYGVHEFAKAGFRDIVDMGTTSELRLVTNILSSVTLTQPKLKYAVESLFAAGQGA
jgi:hypothetical protein